MVEQLKLHSHLRVKVEPTLIVIVFTSIIEMFNLLMNSQFHA